MFAGWLWCRERIWRRQHQQKTHATASTSAHLPETTHWSLFSYLRLIVDFLCINTLDLGWWNSNSAKRWGLERSALKCLTETRGQEDRISSWKTNEIKEGRGFYICKIFSQLALHIWKIEHLSDTTGWCWARRVRTIARWKPGLRGQWLPSTTRERWGLSSTSFLPTLSLGFLIVNIFFEVFLEVAVKTFSLRFILNDVSSAMGEGRAYQTVQTGTCEAKGPSAPCGGGGFFKTVQNLILLFNSSLNNQHSMWWRR